MVGQGHPTFTYGLRGIAALELKVTGAATDLHSGIYGGAVANPAMALARLLSCLHDSEGRIAVPGFYNGIPPLESWEREAWAKLPFGDEEILAVTGAPELFGEAGYTSLERTWARPTAEVNGIVVASRASGRKTVLPREAFAKLTFGSCRGKIPRL
jgi:acetylornithine deacetylase/succinyl-diaminopimelate desuccinylase-like protein